MAARTDAADVSVFSALVVVGLVGLVVEIAALWRVFRKAGAPGWAALVPFYNVWVLLRITGKPAWWFILWFVPGVNLGVVVLVYRELARRFGRGAGFTVGLVLLNAVFVPVLGFGSAQYAAPEGPPADAATYRPVGRRPVLAAVVSAVAVAALAVVYFVVPDGDSDAPAGSLTATEQAAVTAAGTGAANLATYSRKNFTKDFQRAVDGTTGELRTDVQNKRATTLSTITKGGFDLYARVSHAALVGPADTSSSKARGYVVLVALNGYNTKNSALPNPQNLQVTVVDVKGAWLINDVTLVSVQ